MNTILCMVRVYGLDNTLYCNMFASKERYEPIPFWTFGDKKRDSNKIINEKNNGTIWCK